MTAKNWMKWALGAALAVATVPAIGQAHSHYTGTVPAIARATPMTLMATSKAPTHLIAHKKHHKHHPKKHGKLHHTGTKLRHSLRSHSKA